MMAEVAPSANTDKSPPKSPPSSPSLGTLLPPGGVTGGLGVFAAEEEPLQAQVPTAFSFNRSPPGLPRFCPDALNKQGGSTPPKERDEAADFTELTNLIISGDESYLEAIKHASTQVLNKADADGMTAFHYAAMHGRAKACDAILSNPGFNATKVGDRNSNTAMHIAALHDQGDVCHIILSHEPSAASVVNHFGDSPCDIARRRGNVRVCEAFENLKDFNL